MAPLTEHTRVDLSDLDARLGDMLQHLEATGQRDNTIVVRFFACFSVFHAVSHAWSTLFLVR